MTSSPAAAATYPATPNARTPSIARTGRHCSAPGIGSASMSSSATTRYLGAGIQPLRRGAAQVGERLEHLVVVGLRRGLGDHVRDRALAVDDERGAQGAPVGLAVHRLLGPDAVRLA